MTQNEMPKNNSGSTIRRINMGGNALSLFIFIIFTITGGDSKRLEGVLDTSSRWEFLTRFCFKSLEGGLVYHIEYPKAYGVQRLLFYYDTPGQWSYVYKRGKTCQEKTAVAMNAMNYFNLDGAKCRTITRDGQEWYQCKASLEFHSSRERWWYLVVERCADPSDTSVKGLYMTYDLHLTNGVDWWDQEFSADQFGILPINIGFFLLYLIMFGLSIFVARVLKKRQLYHSTYAMYLTSVGIWMGALLCQVIAWGSYSNTGWEMKKMEVFGRILQAASTIIFMLMLILMAKGYTIVRGRLTNKAAVKITVFIMLYIVMSITLFVWEAQIFDEGKVLFYYENPAGYCMVSLQLLGWLWLTKAAVFTLKHYSNTTAKFYIPYYLLFTFWFWAAPFVITLSITVLPKWMREKIVHGVLQTVAFLGHAVFLILTRPSKANSNFPYNIKTSQIDIVGDEDEDQPQDTDSTNMYTVNNHSLHQGTGPNLDMFVVAKGSTHNEGTTFAQAGYPPQRSHPPLDPFMAAHFGGPSSSSSDSPPPSYPQVMQYETPPQPDYDNTYTPPSTTNRLPPLVASNQLPPPIGHDGTRGTTTTLPPIGHDGTRGTTTTLPPIGHDGTRGTTTTLPPIRGTGLPSLETEPSAPPLSPLPSSSSHIPGDERGGDPPDYSALFEAK